MLTLCTLWPLLLSIVALAAAQLNETSHEGTQGTLSFHEIDALETCEPDVLVKWDYNGQDRSPMVLSILHVQSDSPGDVHTGQSKWVLATVWSSNLTYTWSFVHVPQGIYRFHAAIERLGIDADSDAFEVKRGSMMDCITAPQVSSGPGAPKSSGRDDSSSAGPISTSIATPQSSTTDSAILSSSSTSDTQPTFSQSWESSPSLRPTAHASASLSTTDDTTLVSSNFPSTPGPGGTTPPIFTSSSNNPLSNPLFTAAPNPDSEDSTDELLTLRGRLLFGGLLGGIALVLLCIGIYFVVRRCKSSKRARDHEVGLKIQAEQVRSYTLLAPGDGTQINMATVNPPIPPLMRLRKPSLQVYQPTEPLQRYSVLRSMPETPPLSPTLLGHSQEAQASLLRQASTLRI